VDVEVCLKEVHELVLNKVNVPTCTVQKERECDCLVCVVAVDGNDKSITATDAI
jgi:hypothetical protein